jgi:hypothetical protein
MLSGYLVAGGSVFQAQIAGYVSAEWLDTLPFLHDLTVVFSAGSRLLLDLMLHHYFETEVSTFMALLLQLVFTIVVLLTCLWVSRRLAYRRGYLPHTVLSTTVL